MGITERPIYHTPYGDVMTWVTGEDATSGAYSLHERTAPPGARSTPHVHHHLSESFYVLSGSFEFLVGEATTHGGAGAFVLAPSGTTHSWRVLSDEPGSGARDLRAIGEARVLRGDGRACTHIRRRGESSQTPRP